MICVICREEKSKLRSETALLLRDFSQIFQAFINGDLQVVMFAHEYFANLGYIWGITVYVKWKNIRFLVRRCFLMSSGGLIMHLSIFIRMMISGTMYTRRWYDEKTNHTHRNAWALAERLSFRWGRKTFKYYKILPWQLAAFIPILLWKKGCLLTVYISQCWITKCWRIFYSQRQM